MSIIIKKCPYCNSNYEFNDDWTTWVKLEPKDCCDACSEINVLKNQLKKYSDSQHEKEWNNRIHEQNMVKDDLQLVKGVTSYSSAHYVTSYRVEGRSEYIKDLVEKIDFIRKMLYLDIGAQFEVLDSIYEKKNSFWNESGNLIRYVHNASFEYIVIKLKECLSGSNSKYSIKKFKNEFANNKNRIFSTQKVYTVFTYDNGSTFEIAYDPFPIVKYIESIEKILDEYSKNIKALKDLRDKNFAHISNEDTTESFNNLSYVDLKRMFSMIKLIYDGFLYAVAPDKLSTIIVDYNIWFSHLDQIVKEYRKNHPRN